MKAFAFCFKNYNTRFYIGQGKSVLALGSAGNQPREDRVRISFFYGIAYASAPLQVLLRKT